MGKKFLAATLILCSMAVVSKAQYEYEEDFETAKPIFISIDWGATAFSSDYKEQAYIRSYGTDDYGYDDYEDATSTVYTHSSKLSAGLKAEFYLTDHISVATGARFVQFNKKLKANNFWHSNQYFYFAARNRHDVTISDCYRIEKISQKIYCIGIPIEFKFSPSRPSRAAHFYLKLGGDASMRINDKVDTYFRDDNMKRYSNDIEATLNSPTEFYASAYAALGFEFGHIDDSRFSFEFQFPAFASNDTDSFLRSDVGIGIQFGLSFPVR